VRDLLYDVLFLVGFALAWAVFTTVDVITIAMAALCGKPKEDWE